MILSSSIVRGEYTEFEQFCIQVDIILENEFSFCRANTYSDEEYDQWAVDYAIECIQQGKTVREVAEGIADQWEPSDAEIMAANPWSLA